MSTLDLAKELGLTPQEFAQHLEAELAKRRMGEFYLDEPYAFHKDLLCQPGKESYLRPFHKEGLEWAASATRKRLKLILWPRGHLKSTIFTTGDSCRKALKNPNIRILINSSTVDTAKPFLIPIKGHFEDPRIVKLYGKLLPGPTDKLFKNNELELTLLSRTNSAIVEPTFTVSGLDKTKTSRHYDVIYHDDLVVRENVGNFEAMDKVYQRWQDSLDLLEPDGEMYVIGTRWHPLDLYGRILDDYVDSRCFDGFTTHHVDGCKCLFDVSVLKLKNDDGSFIFDSKFDNAVVNGLITMKGRVEFASQYLNDPADPETVWFPRPQIDASLCSAQEIDELRSQLVWYMAVDPAESLESRASYTAVVCVGVDHNTGMWYVDYAKQARVDTPDFVKLVFDSYNLCHPHRFGLEKKTRKALEYNIKDRMAQVGQFWNIEELEPMLGNQPNAKEIRIRGLKPLFEFGRIRVKNTLTDLLTQLSTIPASKSWDLCDALSYIEQMAPKGLGASKVNPSTLPRKVIQNGGLIYRAAPGPLYPGNADGGAGRRTARLRSNIFRRVC